MAIAMRCQACAARFAVKDHLAGKVIRCIKCKGKLAVPRPAESEGEAEPSPPSAPDRQERPKPPSVASSARAPGRSKSKTVLLIVLGAVGGVTVVACTVLMVVGAYLDNKQKTDQKEAFAYNETMAGATRRVNEARDRLEVDIADYLIAVLVKSNKQLRPVRGRPIRQIDPADVRRAYIDLCGLRAAVRAEVAAWKVPPAARPLHDKFEKILAIEDAAMSKLDDLIGIMEDNTLAAQEKYDRGFRILEDNDAAERPHWTELEKLQEDFARTHGFMLQPKRSTIRPEQIRR